MEATLEFQAVPVPVDKSASISLESPMTEPVCEIKLGDPDLFTLQKLLKIPINFELKGVSVEIPLFASKEEVTRINTYYLNLMNDKDMNILLLGKQLLHICDTFGGKV